MSRWYTLKRAFTLIELTVVLTVIVSLALILTPSIGNFISESKAARARSDCTAIARAIVQFYTDNGFFPLWLQARDGGPGQPASRLELLVSPGNIPQLPQEALTAAIPSVNWATGRAGALWDQLVANVPGYAGRTPGGLLGWNGPYLSSAIGPDPWDNRYTVNIGLVATRYTGEDPAGRGKRAVWVISAGPNGVIDTPYSQPNTSATGPAGDDLGVRLQ